LDALRFGLQEVAYLAGLTAPTESLGVLSIPIRISESFCATDRAGSWVEGFWRARAAGL
jgi:hypothetical protein